VSFTYFVMGLNEQLNNFIKILDLLKKKGGVFLFCHCHGNLVFVFLIEIGFANLVSNPIGFESELA
jgi:hypothetical protein